MEKVVSDTEELENGDSSNSQLPGSSATLEILSNNTFVSLKDQVCENTLEVIEDMGFTVMTEIQSRAITPLLTERNLGQQKLDQ